MRQAHFCCGVVLLLMGCGDSTGLDGALRVRTSTSGQDTYAGGYTVTLDDTQTEAQGLLDTTEFVHVTPGEHTVRLGGVPAPCSVVGEDVRTVSVESEQTADVEFAIECPAEIHQDVVFTSLRDGNEEIYRMSSLGAGVIRLTDNPASDRHPTWSPDGSKIAFDSDRDGLRNIYVMDADGSNVRQVVDNVYGGSDPDWSPDGTSLIYLTDANIYSVNLDGTGRVNLTNEDESVPRSFHDPRWSPDGATILVTLGSGINTGIFAHVVRFDPSSGAETSLLNVPTGDVSAAAWSPDGSRIALRRVNDIWLVNPDGSGAIPLTDDEVVDDAPAWSPDGAYLLFNVYLPEGSVLYRIRADGTERLRVADQFSLKADWR